MNQLQTNTITTRQRKSAWTSHHHTQFNKAEGVGLCFGWQEVSLYSFNCLFVKYMFMSTEDCNLYVKPCIWKCWLSCWIVVYLTNSCHTCRLNSHLVVSWLIDRQTDWLTDWLIKWLIDWLIDWKWILDALRLLHNILTILYPQKPRLPNLMLTCCVLLLHQSPSQVLGPTILEYIAQAANVVLQPSLSPEHRERLESHKTVPCKKRCEIKLTWINPNGGLSEDDLFDSSQQIWMLSMDKECLWSNRHLGLPVEAWCVTQRHITNNCVMKEQKTVVCILQDKQDRVVFFPP